MKRLDSARVRVRVMCLETALKIGKLAAWESARRDTMSAAVATTKNINSTTLRLSSLSELLHSPATELLACCDSTGSHENTERPRRCWIRVWEILRVHILLNLFSLIVLVVSKVLKQNNLSFLKD